ncbi:MAG: TadE/TadG family type IV pilus assembly protein [Acidimicrobiia bacterium]
MVEFAVVMPLFLLLLFGVMEAGWLFAQQVEVRNAAREGGRLAVVDYPVPGSGDSSQIVSEVCDRADISSPTRITISANADSATVTVETDYTGLTGFIPGFDGVISSTTEMRLERDAITWTDISDQPCA